MSRTSDRSLPTSKDVAALAGVSQSTVSYVLSGKRSISAETKRRVEAAIAQLTYQPNAGARALRGRRTNVIALVARLSQATDVTDTIPYIDTVVEQARERDFDVVLVTAGQGPDELIRLAKRSICDGIVLMDIRAQDARVATAAGLGLPVVLIGTPDDGHGLHAVDIDARRAGELLAAELAETGHRHLVVVGEAPEVRRAGFPFIGEFHDGAVGVASARGLDLRVVHPPRPGWEGLKEMAEALFGQAGDRLGVIARTPQAIGWVLQLAVLRGLLPGRDISLVGQCTDEAALRYGVPVTNVSPEPRRTVRLAMSLLFDQLDGVPVTGTTRHVLQPPSLTRRASTAVFGAG
ncbi:DNA-binding LacI/PurR family transcriptional regulator [Nonomuraea thailandensis]|uniref:DNA-binding LacI/PurR family transcriptional regulator n=1 Tax=Nonomuraea thailandensis TaxID=1188745 RepID=A0A9X2K1F3_9ACTN|nr:LacI family DNA-binding transcriptional regulator [Nonomuraea thailandensis]MCP2356918.1 DNA-binding LacI/PurR family transcriptional regulator [Nonomuraea thailandensis]